MNVLMQERPTEASASTPAPPRSGSPRRRIRWGRVFAWIALLAIMLVTLFPFYWMIRTALSTNSALYLQPGNLLPVEFSWGEYVLWHVGPPLVSRRRPHSKMRDHEWIFMVRSGLGRIGDHGTDRRRLACQPGLASRQRYRDDPTGANTCGTFRNASDRLRHRRLYDHLTLGR